MRRGTPPLVRAVLRRLHRESVWRSIHSPFLLFNWGKGGGRTKRGAHRCIRWLLSVPATRFLAARPSWSALSLFFFVAEPGSKQGTAPSLDPDPVPVPVPDPVPVRLLPYLAGPRPETVCVKRDGPFLFWGADGRERLRSLPEGERCSPAADDPPPSGFKRGRPRWRASRPRPRPGAPAPRPRCSHGAAAAHLDSHVHVADDGRDAVRASFRFEMPAAGVRRRRCERQ